MKIRFIALFNLAAKTLKIQKKNACMCKNLQNKILHYVTKVLIKYTTYNSMMRIYNYLWDGCHYQLINASLRVVHFLFYKARIDYIIDSINGQGCFCNVGSNDDLIKTDLFTYFTVMKHRHFIPKWHWNSVH